MLQLKDFINQGHGWVCRQCDNDLAPKFEDPNRLPRFYREGESETKELSLANKALAQWTDKTRRFLRCPLCGIVESVDIS